MPPTPENLPEIADWLYLREAAAAPGAAARAALYAKIRSPLVRGRIPWTEAEALETAGDTAAALRIYRTLPAPVTTLRLRFALAKTDATRTAVRHDLVALIASSGSAAQIQEAATLLDRIAREPTPAEHLTIARATAAHRLWRRSAAEYAAALRWNDREISSRDAWQYGNALAAIGRRGDAVAMYARVRSPASLLAAARYQRARLLVAMGNREAALTQLRGIETYYPADTSAGWAMWLRADLASDAGNDSAARTLWLRLATQFPEWRLAPQARFQAALVAFIQKDYYRAADEFKSLSDTTTAFGFSARYWWARAAFAQRDTTRAKDVWWSIILRDSTSYYALLTAKRLQIDVAHAWLDAVPVRYPRVPAVDSAAKRILLLREMQMPKEAQFEVAHLVRDARRDRNRLFATAAALSATEDASHAIALGASAYAQYGPTPEVMHLLYPIAARRLIITHARESNLDPALVAGLIRQESRFNPYALSPADARGLMQVMPAVGEMYAAQRGIQSWSAGQLYEPNVNIPIGMAHLKALSSRQSDLIRVLSAYNAGESRVARWAQKAGADDPEVFTERIPFVETREYVKEVLRNREFYRVLYAW